MIYATVKAADDAICANCSERYMDHSAHGEWCRANSEDDLWSTTKKFTPVTTKRFVVISCDTKLYSMFVYSVPSLNLSGAKPIECSSSVKEILEMCARQIVHREDEPCRHDWRGIDTGRMCAKCGEIEKAGAL